MSLRTASDYVYTDVSAIEISGNYLPTRQDNIIRGEDIALIREFAADTEAVMGYGNPFTGMERIHKIVDLSYIRTRWWDVQKARTLKFPVSREPSIYESGWGKVCDGYTYSKDEMRRILRGLIDANRIRTGDLSVPTANDALAKSAVSSLVSNTVVTNPYNNYFASILVDDGAYAEYDLTNGGTIYHKHCNPYRGIALPWQTTGSDCFFYGKFTSAGSAWYATASSISLYPSSFPSQISRSKPVSMTCDIVLVASKGVGGALGPSAENTAMFCLRDVCVAGQPFADLSSIPYQTILSEIPTPSGSGDHRQEIILLCGVLNPVVRWNLNASP